MDIPLNVDVRCADGPGGRSSTIILNPISMEITHVVVKDNQEEYLVPVDLIAESTPTHIQLRCLVDELVALERFVRMQFLGQEEIDLEGDLRRTATESDANYWPYNSLEDGYVEMYGMAEQIPHHELAIHRGSHVEATNGHIGQVDEFIVNPTNNHITHLVLRRGHLWGKKDITISVKEIDHIEQDIVLLKLTKDEVKALPAVALRRKSG
jgi:sporulation protein YlmC with PRC-barrel domain